MKALKFLLGLITATLLLGVAAFLGRIRAYNATGEVDITYSPLILGMRVNLTCTLTSPPSGNEVLSYRWYHNCRSQADNSCEIQNGDTYRVRNDTLSMNVTSYDQEGRYTCAVQYGQMTVLVPGPFISVAGDTRTPTTSTPVVSGESPPSKPVDSRERSAPTPVDSRESPSSTPVVSGESPPSKPVDSRERPTSTTVVNTTSTTASTTTTERNTSNFSPTPSGPEKFSRKTFITQPVGTFVGVGVGVGMFVLLVVLTSVVVLILVVVVVRRKGAKKQKRHGTIRNNLQCNNTDVVISEMEKKKRSVDPSSESIHIYDTVDGNENADNGTDKEGSPMGFPPYEVGERTEHRRIPALKKPFNPARAEDGCSAKNIHEYDVPMSRRNTAYTQERTMKMGDNPYYNNTVVVQQEMAMKENSSVADCENADGYEDVDNDKSEDDDPAEDGYNPHEVAGRKELFKNTKTPVPKESCTRAGVNSAHYAYVIYTVEDKSKTKKIRHEEDVSIDANNHQYAIPMKKKKRGVRKKHGFF